MNDLTDSEQACKARYDAARERGHSVAEAAYQAIAAMLPSARRDAYVDWLSEGHLRLSADRRLIRMTRPRSKPISKPILTPEDVGISTRKATP